MENKKNVDIKPLIFGIILIITAVTNFLTFRHFKHEKVEQELRHNIELMELQRTCTEMEARYIQTTFHEAERSSLALVALRKVREEYGNQFSFDFDNAIKYTLENDLRKAAEHMEQVDHDNKITR
jgi:HAMP domain-containing protein